MSKYISLIILFTMTGCCTSRYCTPHRAVKSAKLIFVDQFRTGVWNTGQNARKCASFIAEDFLLLVLDWEKLQGLCTGELLFLDLEKRIKKFGSFVGNQINDSIENTPKNLKIIAKYMCFCCDEEE